MQSQKLPKLSIFTSFVRVWKIISGVMGSCEFVNINTSTNQLLGVIEPLGT